MAEEKKQNKYLIEISHNPSECAMALKQIGATGYITHFNWACKNGQHTGWAILDASSETEALNILPVFYRQKAKVTKVNVFTREEAEGMH